MTKQTFTQKQTGDSLSASEWNELTGYVNQAVDAINNNNGQPAAIDASGVVSVNSKGNTTISATKHINIEPVYDANGTANGTYGDVQIKPGDDITLESHHRSLDKRDEITIKTSNGQSGASKAPVKLQVIAADMTLSSKGKTGNDPEVMNINVTDGSGKGYLKVRAQAIDLRCEEHGGIALQPKGTDSQSHMNKIKFEHGGGDGLEFGTFNAEKTSIFTDEYRFNKDGVWKMATRIKEVSDKYDDNDETTHYKYTKAADDFYDQIDVADEQCTTRDIIKTAAALNGNPCIHAKITNSGNLEIATATKFLLSTSGTAPDVYNQFAIDSPYPQSLPSQEVYSPVTPTLFIPGKYYSLSEVTAPIASASDSGTRYVSGNSVGNVDMAWVRSQFTSGLSDQESMTLLFEDGIYYTFTKYAAPDIKIDSGADLKLGGILDFGSSFNFGETDNGIEVQYKLTKKNNIKDCGVLKVIGVNNHATNDLTAEGVTIAPGQTDVIAQCSILDIIKLVNYMKTNNEGPWAQQL